MADYSNSRNARGSNSPENAIDGQSWSRNEPLITPSQLRLRFLWGIPLVSNVIDPFTQMPAVLTDTDLKDIIVRAVAQVEMDSKIDVFAVKRLEKKPFDANEMREFGYMRAQHRPILSVDSLTISPGEGPALLTVQKDWIDSGGFTRGEIRIVPTLGGLSAGYVPNASGTGSHFMAIMGGMAYSPSFWKLEYTTGFSDGRVPVSLNELIGCYAAIDVLSLIGTTNKAQSASLGMDGMSQSQSTGGTSVYDPRIKLLDEKRQGLLKKFRALYGNKFSIGTV